MADILATIAEALRLAEQLTVPTRIYFPAGTVPIETANPAFDAAWNSTGAAARRKPVVDGRKRGTAAASVTVTSAATNPEKICLAQYVSQPLRAQTISGNVRGQFRALESNAAFNGTLQIGIRVLSNDGQTVRGTLLAVGGTVTTATTPPEFTTALTNRRLLTSGDVTPLPLSSVACLEGDRLCIEIGVADKDSGTARTAQISFGDNTVDLLTDDTTTTAQDPWIEFDTTIAFQTAVEPLEIADSGTTQLWNQGWVKLADSVTAQLSAGNDLNKNLADLEVVHVVDTLTVARGLTAVVADEALHVVDTVTASLFLQRAVTDEALRIADTLTAALTPLEASAAESVHVVDDRPPTILLITFVSVGPESLVLDDVGQGLTSLLGVIHVQDTVTAAIATGNDLTVALNPGETLHLGDSVTSSRDLTATPSEALIVADTVTAARDLTPSLTEALRVADSLTGRFDPILASPSETLRISEALTAEVQGPLGATPASEEPTHLQEGPPIGRLDPLQQTIASADILRLQDSPAAELNPRPLLVGAEALRLADTVTTQITMTASAAEALRVVDSGTTALWNQGWIKLGDSVTAELGAPVDTTTLQAVVSEGLRLSDRVVILQAVLNETLRVIDSGFGQTQLLGVLHIQDSVQAQVGGQLSTAPTEALRLQDVLLQPERTPYEVTASEVVKLAYTQSEVEYTQDEYARLIDVVGADLAAPGTLSTAISEGLRLGDVATMNRDLVALPTQEVGKLGDSLTMSRDVEATPTESGRLADSITVIQDQLVTVTEALRIADTTLRTLDPEEGVTIDTGILADALAVNLGNPDDLATGLTAEHLALTESLALFGDLTVSLTETVRIVEVVDAGNATPLIVSLSETFHILDLTESGADLRIGLEQEDFPLRDTVTATLAAPIVLGVDYVRADDGFFLVAMDLAVVIGPDPDPTIVIPYCIVRIRSDVTRILVRPDADVL